MLPSIATRLSATTCLFLASEGASNLGTRGAYVAVYDSAVASTWAYPSEHCLKALGEDGRREALRHLVVVCDGFLKSLELEHVEDWSKDFLLDNWSVVSNCRDGWEDVVARPIGDDLASKEDFAALSFYRFNSFLVLLHSSLGVKWS